MKRDVVGRRAQFIQRHQGDTELLGQVGRNERIVGDDLHTERLRATRDFLTNPPEAGDTERLAANFGAEQVRLVPAAILHRAIGRRYRSRERQNQRPGVLGDADAARTGGVDHENAARAGRLDVDVVHADARPRDDSQAQSGRDQARVHFRGASHEQCVRIRNVGCQLRRRPPAARVDGPPVDPQCIQR